MRRRLSLFPVLAALTCFTAGMAGAEATAPATLDPQRPRWSALEFTATKFFLSASSRIEVRQLPASALGSELRTPPLGHAVAAPAAVIEVTYTSEGAGHDSVTRLWIDPADGAALQRRQSDRGSRLRERIYRYTDIGAWHYTRWPATQSETSLPAQQWTRIEEGLRAYPQAVQGQRITEPSALLWMIAAANLSRPGDRLDTLAFSGRSVSRVTIEVTGRRKTGLRYQERRTNSSRSDSIDALVLRLGAVRIDDPSDTEDFELLGLRGNLELLLDPETRAVLELRGQAKLLGRITVRLTAMTQR